MTYTPDNGDIDGYVSSLIDGELTHLRGRLLTNAEVEKFCLAGNATITVVYVKTGARYTYRIKKPDDFKQERPIWFVSVLKGSDNDRDFGYIGQIKLVGGNYVYERGKKCWHTWFPASDGFSWTWKQVIFRVEKEVHPSVEIWHEGRCGRCGRKLTVPESVSSGYGPECINYV
jgi:hypothetical protein